jgi:hypothetical protein
MRSVFVLALCAIAASAPARVLRVDVATCTDVLDGRVFGEAGAYERLTGRVYFAVDVANAHNRAIVDLDKAVNLADGAVEFSADFVALRPKDPAKANGTLLLEVPNRGRPYIVELVDDGDKDLARDAGDAWLLRRGFSVASLGWQWDASGDALRLYAPVAKDHGKAITGLLRGDYMPSQPLAELPLGHYLVGAIGGSEYPVAAPDDARNTLTVRDARNAPRTPIARSRWRFAHAVDGKIEASDRFIRLDGGFQPGKLYEYVYVVADPVIAGLGFAAVRDFAAWAKHGAPQTQRMQRVIGEGISQNGRFLRDLLWQGFNADEDGRIALDGVLAHVAGAGRGNFNYRFAQPSRDAQPTSSIDFATDLFPFTDLPQTDPLTGARAGLLDRASAEHVVPKIFFSNTSYEYWGRAAGLLGVSADGRRDASLSPDVRLYHLTGLQHFSVRFPPPRGSGDLLGRQPESPLPVRWFWRAMIANMDAWLRDGAAPPPSSHPRLADGTLVPLRAYAFPQLPGIERPHEASEARRLDFGPHWRDGIVERQPPKEGAAFPVLVPQVDADGNERDGVRLPEIVAPLATYTGWNLRDPSIGAAHERVSFEGSFIPFAKTAAERERTHDPRRAIAERYRDRDDYLARFTAALDGLIAQHWILPEDRDALLERGAQEWDALAAP